MKNKLVTALAVTLLSAPSYADTLVELQKCASTKDSLVRLVCYDNVMKSLNNGQTAQKPVTVRATEPANAQGEPVPLRPVNDRVIVTKQPETAEERFGQEHLEKSDQNKPTSLDEVVFTIASAKKDSREKWLITFTNGQIWRQSDSEYISLSADDRVELSKGMLGVVYLGKVGQNKKIRVKRKQ